MSGPSAMAKGMSTAPPAMSCHAVVSRGFLPAGCPQRLARTMPKPMLMAEPRPAITPTTVSRAPGVSVMAETPRSASMAATMCPRVGLIPNRKGDMAIATSGEVLVRMAATPPGSCWAAINSSVKNNPILSIPSTADRHHHELVGRVRVIRSRISPAGRARSSPAVTGCPAGSQVVVTAYVVPQTMGVRAVLAAMTFAFISLFIMFLLRLILNSLTLKYYDMGCQNDMG